MFREEEPSEEVDADKIMRSSGLSFFRSTQAGRMTTNNFFRRSSPANEDDGSSASDLISNSTNVMVGNLSMLRNKTKKHSNYGPVKLSNDIGSLVKDFHQEASSVKKVSATSLTSAGCAQGYRSAAKALEDQFGDKAATRE